jgi:hypothetical protein
VVWKFKKGEYKKLSGLVVKGYFGVDARKNHGIIHGRLIFKVKSRLNASLAKAFGRVHISLLLNFAINVKG